MDIKKLQAQINREAWQRYRAAQAGTAGTPAAREVADFIAEHERKHGRASDLQGVVTPSTDGPQTRAAMKVAAAISRARAGDVGEANGSSSRVVGNHKLAPYVFGG